MRGEFLRECPVRLQEHLRSLVHALASPGDLGLSAIAFLAGLVVVVQQAQRVDHLAVTRPCPGRYVGQSGVGGNAPALVRFERVRPGQGVGRWDLDLLIVGADRQGQRTGPDFADASGQVPQLFCGAEGIGVRIGA